MKSWLQDNNIEMHSTYNKGKPVVVERFNRTLENKIYKYMKKISKKISKNLCIDKLDDIVNKYNNTYYRTIKINSVDVNPSIYIDFDKTNNKKDPKFKVDDYLKIWKYKSIFAKGYVPNWSEKVFVIKKVKNTVPWTCFIRNLNGKEIVGTFYEKES